MRYEFTATHVGYDDDNDAMTVAFGGFPDADNFPTIVFMLQRSTDEDEDEPGINGVYAEWLDQEMSGYGCIEGFTLFQDGAHVVVNDRADFYPPDSDNEMGLTSKITELVIRFSLGGQQSEELKERLADTIFLNCDCFIVRNNEVVL